MKRSKPYYQNTQVLGKDKQGRIYIKDFDQLTEELLLKTTVQDKKKKDFQPIDYFEE